jgi:hypothetical protein
MYVTTLTVCHVAREVHFRLPNAPYGVFRMYFECRLLIFCKNSFHALQRWGEKNTLTRLLPAAHHPPLNGFVQASQFFAKIRFMLRRGEENRTLSHDCCCQLPAALHPRRHFARLACRLELPSEVSEPLSTWRNERFYLSLFFCCTHIQRSR